MANGSPLNNVIEIIEEEQRHSDIAVVVSARGNSTDLLIKMYELTVEGKEYEQVYDAFVQLQDTTSHGLEVDELFVELKEILDSVKRLKISSDKLKDKIVSYGELLSARLISHILVANGLNAVFVDARNIFKTNNGLKSSGIDHLQSQGLTKAYFDSLEPGQIPIITGFIASNDKNETVTLGRNGSNLSASLIANFIDAEEVQNWTDVNGVYTASPKLVQQAELISHLSFKEAHELANFGTTILHPRTINPLMEKGIPIKIYNSIDRQKAGTIIDMDGSKKGIKVVSAIENVAMISIESKDITARVGISGRIFSALGKYNVSVRLISQASTDLSVGFVVDSEDSEIAKNALIEEFETELENGSILGISLNTNVVIIAIIGRHNYALEKAIYGLRKNKIWMYLISNSISGSQISLVIDSGNLQKAVNIVYEQVFEKDKSLEEVYAT